PLVNDGMAVQKGKAAGVTVISARPVYHGGRPGAIASVVHANVKDGEGDAEFILVHEDKNLGRAGRLGIRDFSISAPWMVDSMRAAAVQKRAPDGRAIPGFAFLVARGRVICVKRGAHSAIHRVASQSRHHEAPDTGDLAPVAGASVNGG